MADIVQIRWFHLIRGQRACARAVLWIMGVILSLGMALAPPRSVQAAPYAAVVVDARTGEVLHSRNADTRLHPASLTKMMTLYIAFEAVRNGEISLDQKVRISKNAAAEPPSKLGLKTGQRIAFRYLVRAAGVKSANDAATAIGEAISGTEAAFARRMTRPAKALDMSRTTFKNAHGLTETGHMSTARDMTKLGRHILYDYPEYYHLFSRTTIDAGVRTVPNTNRRLLASYKGADGIKTGYTRAAGSNLVASAKRGNERIIATVFGGKSSTSRNAKVAELLDLGFRRAPSRAKLRTPGRPAYVGNKGIGASTLVAGAEQATTSGQNGGAGKTIRVNGLVKSSLRPKGRPLPAAPIQIAEATATSKDLTESALQEAQTAASSSNTATDTKTDTATGIDPEILQASITAAIAEAKILPASTGSSASATAEPSQVVLAKAVLPRAQTVPFKGLRPLARPASFAQAQTTGSPAPVVITRLSTSGGRYWGINVGRYTSRYQAEKVLLRTALSEMESLDGTLRKVAESRLGFDANFLGMSKEGAELACRRLRARNVTCDTLGPAS
ncbi:D-alanyl-D-alanine carboxypeptidase family protein [Pseudophaeobacter leonis]|uniref:D-alanyl-D-alanine carboxypeptidase family protein n=1 Tax=Pseudophaeobacter leonis TaxID=1144477 RepID=UPI0009F57F4D|nr:D-alanyl-D-alanine carboxypeptidase family protein [Pseudophaeobacter leonis]